MFFKLAGDLDETSNRKMNDQEIKSNLISGGIDSFIMAVNRLDLIFAINHSNFSYIV